MRHLGPSYNRLLTAFTISNVGNGVLIAALPLLVASSTRNPLAISGLMVAAGLPWLLIGPFSGAIVDRVDRRRAMILAEAGRVVVMGAATFYVFGGGDSIVALYALLILVGVGETFFDAAGLALVPGLVAPSQLDAANGRLFGIQTLAQRFIGPPIGGWLFAFAAWVPLGIDAVSFLAAALVVLWLPRSQPREIPKHPSGGLLAETIEGIRWVWRDSVLRALVVGTGVLHFSTGAGLSVLVLIAQDRYQLTGFGFGLTLGALAIGFILGYTAAPSIAKKVPRPRMCVGALFGAAAGFLLVAGAGVPWLGGLGLALVGGSAAQLDVVSISFRQAWVPDRILGRVMAGFLFVGHGATPIGALFGGLVAAWAGVGYTYVASGLFVLVAVPYLWVALKDEELDPDRLQGESTDS
jgi:predicted MFS family arabinose efflux permease